MSLNTCFHIFNIYKDFSVYLQNIYFGKYLHLCQEKPFKNKSFEIPQVHTIESSDADLLFF